MNAFCSGCKRGPSFRLSSVSTERPSTAAASVRQERCDGAVNQHRAGAAAALPAAEFRRRVAELLAQRDEQIGRRHRRTARRRGRCDEIAAGSSWLTPRRSAIGANARPRPRADTRRSPARRRQAPSPSSAALAAAAIVAASSGRPSSARSALLARSGVAPIEPNAMRAPDHPAAAGWKMRGDGDAPSRPSVLRAPSCGSGKPRRRPGARRRDRQHQRAETAFARGQKLLDRRFAIGCSRLAAAPSRRARATPPRNRRTARARTDCRRSCPCCAPPGRRSSARPDAERRARAPPARAA